MLLIIDNGSVHTPELKEYLAQRKVKYKIYNKKARLKTIMKEKFKGVILTGGPLLYDSKINIHDIEVDLAVLLDIQVPILGICFGHQTICEAFDGCVQRMKKPVQKTQRIHIIKSNPLFKGLPKEMDMTEFHTDCAVEMPYNFDRLAKSKQCSIEAVKHKTKPIYGVQFHPEASGVNGYKMLDNFLAMCGIIPRKNSKIKKKKTKK